jgi:hypothetical protein
MRDSRANGLSEENLPPDCSGLRGGKDPHDVEQCAEEVDEAEVPAVQGASGKAADEEGEEELDAADPGYC